jgi:alkaline phosphatase
MTVQALKLLSQNPEGYILLVEGGNIDNAHHDGYARHALQETSEMDDAVAYAVEVTDPDDTLIIVTADHSHTLTIAGYPQRGADILGLCKRICSSTAIACLKNQGSHLLNLYFIISFAWPINYTVSYACIVSAQDIW